MFTHPQTFPKLGQTYIKKRMMSFYNLKIFKKKPHKSHMNNASHKDFKNIYGGGGERRWRLKLIWNYEIWSNYNHSKVNNT